MFYIWSNIKRNSYMIFPEAIVVIVGMVTHKDSCAHPSSEPSGVAGSRADQWWPNKKGREVGSEEHREIILEMMPGCH